MEEKNYRVLRIEEQLYGCEELPEGQPVLCDVLLEAAATGRPVITSDIYGCREAVDEGITGLLCQVKDADSLYEQMKKMALLSREERAQMGIAAREKMERQFDKKVVVKNTIDAISPNQTVSHTGR